MNRPDAETAETPRRAAGSPPGFLATRATGVLAALLIGAALTAAGCGEGPGYADEPPAPEADLRPTVSVTPVTTTTLTDVLEISGQFEPRAEVVISSEGGGMVEEVLFDKGDRVEAGQLLARVNTDLLRVALLEAEADLAGAQADHDRVRQLVEREATPEERLTETETRLRMAEARTEAARLRFARSEVVAPAAGIIVSRDLEPGEVLAPGSRVAVLHDTSSLRATVGIPETDIAWFRVGAPAEVTLDAYPDRIVQGRITWIAPNATQPGRNFLTEIEVPNPDGSLRSGLIVRTRLERRVFEEAVVVSRDVLVERDAVLYAFVLEDGLVALREVTLGPDEGDRVVVTSGLDVGQTLLVAGHRNLIAGEAVRVVED